MQDPSRRPEPVKRVRPRNPAACTRCKNRKQRCDLIEGSAVRVPVYLLACLQTDDRAVLRKCSLAP